MPTGTVKFFNESKDYGFVTDDETGKDIVVHVTRIKSQSRNEGDKVSYQEEEGRKGKVAAQVEVIEGLYPILFFDYNLTVKTVPSFSQRFFCFIFGTKQ